MTRFSGVGAMVMTAVLASCGPQGARLGSRADALGSSTLVISQVFGGGGSSGARVRSDFVELHNVSSATVSLSGLSLQYASAQGVSWSKTALPDAQVPAGGFFLIELASSGSAGSVVNGDFEYPTMNIAQSDFKLALVDGLTALQGSCPVNDWSVVDFVGTSSASCFEGFDATPSASVSTALVRAGSGCQDTDDNGSDFSTGTPTPRSAASATATCGPTPSGTRVDAGTVESIDAGLAVRPIIDAGVLPDDDAGVRSVVVVDAGLPVDAGQPVTIVPTVDAGHATDAGTPMTMGAPVDTMHTDNAPAVLSWSATNGAGCQAAPFGPVGALLALALLRRRRA